MACRRLTLKFCNVTRDFREIVIQLMVTPHQPPHVSAWNGARVQLDMRNGDNVVILTMIQEHWNPSRQPLGETGLRHTVFTRPAALTNEWCRDQNDRSQFGCGRRRSQGIDQNRSSNGVAHDDGAVPKRGEFLLENGLPCR